MATFVVRAPGNREVMEIYMDPKCCANVDSWNVNNCVSNLMGIYFQQARDTQESVKSKCRTVEVIFSPQPADEVQDSTFDAAAPYIFCFVLTSSLKNYTAGFQSYLLNKVKGLVRAVERTGMVMTADEADLSHLIPSGEVLNTLRDFFDHHPIVLKILIQHLLALANPHEDVVGPVTTYATEALTSIEYIYMTGVKLIEEYLIQPRHTVCMNPTVAAYLTYYYDYKRQVTETYRNNWLYSAVLDRDTWRNYSRTKSFKELWMISAIIAGVDEESYNDIIINNIRVGVAAGKPKYRRLIGRFQKAGDNMATGGSMYGNREADFISRFLGRAGDTSNHHDDDASAVPSMRSRID